MTTSCGPTHGSLFKGTLPVRRGTSTARKRCPHLSQGDAPHGAQAHPRIARGPIIALGSRWELLRSWKRDLVMHVLCMLGEHEVTPRTHHACVGIGGVVAHVDEGKHERLTSPAVRAVRLEGPRLHTCGRPAKLVSGPAAEVRAMGQVHGEDLVDLAPTALQRGDQMGGSRQCESEVRCDEAGAPLARRRQQPHVAAPETAEARRTARETTELRCRCERTTRHSRLNERE